MKLLLSWQRSKESILAAGSVANQVPKFKVTNAKLFVAVVTLSTKENIKLLKQLESGFRRAIGINIVLKSQFKIKTDIQMFYLIQVFKKVYRLFVLSLLSLEGGDGRKQLILSSTYGKDYNVAIEGRNFSFKW